MWQLFILFLIANLFSVAQAEADFQVAAPVQRNVSTAQQAPDGQVFFPQLCPNAPIAVYASDAENLVTTDSNGAEDIFLTDLSKGSVSILSVKAGTTTPANNHSTFPSISTADESGEIAVAFQSDATNLGTNLTDGNTARDIYLNIPSLNLLEPITSNVSSGVSNGDSGHASIFAQPGMTNIKIAFDSSATNFITGDTNGVVDVYLATVSVPSSGVLSASNISFERVSQSADGLTEGNGTSQSPVISGNGRYIAYESVAYNLIGQSFFTVSQIYLYDTETKATTLVSRNTNNLPGDSTSTYPSISYNGRYIAYLTNSTDIISGATGTIAVRYDTLLNQSTRVDLDVNSTAATGAVSSVAISPNGRYVGFTSTGPLVPEKISSLPDSFIKDMDTGAIARTSITGTTIEADGASDFATVGGAKFNASKFLIGYISFSTNLTSTPVAPESGALFTNQITVTSSASPITNGAKIETPPDVKVNDNKNSATFTFQKFSTTVLQASLADAALEQATSGRREVRYELELRQTRRGGTRSNIVTKRNTITVRNLRPGTYTARYRARKVNVSNGSTVAKTAFSPRQRFTVE